MKKLSCLIGAGALAIVTAVVQSPQKAEAATPWMDVCNSTASEMYGTSNPYVQPGIGSRYLTLYAGGCQQWDNPDNTLRVWVPAESYRWGIVNQGYTECRNGPLTSNPPDAANGQKITYKTYRFDNCTN